jgi:tagaturonate reductase
MKPLTRQTANIQAPFPIKILQFGGGNFLRAFTDWMIDVYNEKTGSNLGVLVVATTGSKQYNEWQKQDGLYHVLTRAFQNGQIIDECRLVKSISRVLHLHTRWKEFLQTAENPDIRFIISNTTEAGIRFSPNDQKADTPPSEFPAKLTLWLYRRYQHFDGQSEAGCIFLPTELILNNGETLRECILQNADNWDLEEEFRQWVRKSNTFCNTLVDRIVPGIGKEALPEEWEKTGYADRMMTQGEAFHFWGIQGPQSIREVLPLNKAGLNVIYTDDLTPYRTRKVRILNGAHTSMVPVGYLYGIETVREAVEHEVMGQFVHKALFEEIIPTLDLPDDELQQFAGDVLDRFKNPFIRHQLISIALNSISKFETRVLPSILEYKTRKGELPPCIVFSLAALIRFYKGSYDGKDIPLKDDEQAISFLRGLWDQCDGSEKALSELAEKVLKWEYAWKQDLSQIAGFQEQLTNYLVKIESEGMQRAVAEILK